MYETSNESNKTLLKWFTYFKKWITKLVLNFKIN